MQAFKARLLKFLILFHVSALIFGLNCREILENNETKFIEWQNMRKCLAEVNGESLSKNISENIWRLIKNCFFGLENIPPEAFLHMGYILTAIPMEELRFLSMERVEVIEAFGAVRTTKDLQGFTAEQSELIAQKLQEEWLGKSSETYSEYDLISMGEIICYLNVSVIKDIHPDAVKNAVEWMGNIKNCPQNRLKALAELITSDEAFGATSTWSKLTVSITGNILFGLSQTEIAAIDEEKLLLNRYYAERFRKEKNRTSETETRMGIGVTNNNPQNPQSSK